MCIEMSRSFFPLVAVTMWLKVELRVVTCARSARPEWEKTRYDESLTGKQQRDPSQLSGTVSKSVS